MKRLIPLAAVFALPLVVFALVAALPTGAAPLPAGEGGMDGKAIFLAQKCDLCHGVSTAGIEAKTKSDKMKGPDLVGVVTAEHDAEWIAQYLKKAADLDGKKHSKGFTGTDEELAALIDWLAAQKKS
jgi:mono/diheme cytochrome c family protein